MNLKGRIYRMEMVLADRCPLCGGKYERDGHLPLSTDEIRPRYERLTVRPDVTRLSDHELEAICADNPAWIKALTDAQLETYCEGGGMPAIWDSLSLEQRRLVEEAS